MTSRAKAHLRSGETCMCTCFELPLVLLTIVEHSLANHDGREFILQRRKVLAILTSPALVAGLILLGGGPASAAVQGDIATSGYVIVHPSDGIIVDGDRTFYPTGPLSSDTLVVMAEPDGSLPGGITKAQLDHVVAQRELVGSSSASGGAIAAGVSMNNKYEGWSSVNWSQAFIGASIIGLNDSTVLYYTFDVNAFTSQTNAGQGLGYYKGYNGSTFGVWAQWYGLGSATPTTTRQTSVPWGNVAATAQFKVKCATTTVCGGHWAP